MLSGKIVQISLLFSLSITNWFMRIPKRAITTILIKSRTRNVIISFRFLFWKSVLALTQKWYIRIKNIVNLKSSMLIKVEHYSVSFKL